MKPFATLGSEISKVRDRVRRGAESLRPARVAPHLRESVRDQRDRLLARLGEQTFRLMAERKLAVPKVLLESVERLAALLGVQIPLPSDPGAEPREPAEVDEPSVGDASEETLFDATATPARDERAPPGVPPTAVPRRSRAKKGAVRRGKR